MSCKNVAKFCAFRRTAWDSKAFYIGQFKFSVPLMLPLARLGSEYSGNCFVEPAKAFQMLKGEGQPIFKQQVTYSN